MSDLIKREDAIKAINLRARIPHDIASAQYASMAINAICSVPSADRPNATEIMNAYHEGVRKGIAEALGADREPSIDIVRCGECKAYDSECEWCKGLGLEMKADDFCSYGEREGE